MNATAPVTAPRMRIACVVESLSELGCTGGTNVGSSASEGIGVGLGAGVGCGISLIVLAYTTYSMEKNSSTQRTQCTNRLNEA